MWLAYQSFHSRQVILVSERCLAITSRPDLAGARQQALDG